jgi:hypothetical protein
VPHRRPSIRGRFVAFVRTNVSTESAGLGGKWGWERGLEKNERGRRGWVWRVRVCARAGG